MAKNTETKTEKFNIYDNIRISKRIYIAGDKVLAEPEQVQINGRWGWDTIPRVETVIRVKDAQELYDYYSIKAEGFEPDEDDED